MVDKIKIIIRWCKLKKVYEARSPVVEASALSGILLALLILLAGADGLLQKIPDRIFGGDTPTFKLVDDLGSNRMKNSEIA